MTTQTNLYQLTSSLPIVNNARWAERLLLLVFLVISDLVTVLGGFWMAYYLRFELGLSWFYQPEVLPYNFYQDVTFVLAPIWIIILLLFGVYDFKNIFTGVREYARLFNACTLGMMLIILYTFFVEEDIARGWVLLAWASVSLALVLNRFIFRRFVQFMRSRGRFLTTILVVGGNEEGRAILDQLHANSKSGVWIAGVVDDKLEAGKEIMPGVPVLGSVASLRMLVHNYGIQEIVIASTALRREKLLNIFQTFGTDSGVVIRLSSGLYELLTTGVEVQEIGNVPLLSVKNVRLDGADTIFKSGLDVMLSLTVLFFLWPIMLFIAIAIKLDDPKGPVFHQREVVGVGGKPFKAWKFRTMYTDADERLNRNPLLRLQFEQNYKLKNDPRVTRVGKYLRQTSLDELPQIFNVLFGQMSLVGPRMITQDEQVRYGKWRMNLGTVKPGITGLWQVSGRSDIGYEERVMLDMHYIRNYSIWFDFYILWLTVPAVLKGKGAY